MQGDSFPDDFNKLKNKLLFIVCGFFLHLLYILKGVSGKSSEKFPSQDQGTLWPEGRCHTWDSHTGSSGDPGSHTGHTAG